MAKLILLNKPFNVLCQFTDQQGRKTLADYISAQQVYPAGRLDYDSEGLVVLTNDGRLQQQISNPKAKLTKTYWAQLEGQPNDADLEPLRQGITLKDGPCRPAKARLIAPPQIWPRQPPVRERKLIPTQWLELTISEGRNRQVRRMTAAIGFPTLRLIRAQIGEWTIDGLAVGESKQLTVHLPNSKLAAKKPAGRPRRRL
jgi:23S rRNA pseudouridine2457 synthase